MRSMYRFGRGLFLAGLCLPAGGACDRSSPARPELRVSAASSTADAVRRIGQRFEKETHIQIAVHHASSGKLAAQIRAGAPCDVFVSADPEMVERLEKDAFVETGTERCVAGNELVVVARRPAEAWPDLRALTEQQTQWIAMGHPAYVPAGRYAEAALKSAGVWDVVQSRLRFGDNVRMAARYVWEGAADVGIVYATDARAFEERLVVVYVFEASAHAPIRYAAATCAGSTMQEASQSFVEFMAGPAAAGLWRADGFAPCGERNTAAAGGDR